MRKGLVVTLGVVALILAVSQSFALAPVISCIPDIIVSDAEQNAATVDRNFFIFSNALDLDTLVRDDDTTKSLLKWCFVESSPGGSIAINGIRSYTGANYRDPVGFNIRAVSNRATFRNIKWSPTTMTIPFPNPGVASMDSMLQMVVSDGTKVDSQPITVRSANNAAGVANPILDSVTGQRAKQYTFATGAEGWTWFTAAPTAAPTNAASGGNLSMTEAAAQNPIVYGAWESPKDPAVAIHLRWGCVLRARYQMRSSVDGLSCPGFRFRGIWTRVAQAGGQWNVDFANQDFGDNCEIFNYTYDLSALGVPGREPGVAGKTMTLLHYGQQFESLMNAQAIFYITCDLVDADSFGNDAGTLYIDQVDVDGFARPAQTSSLATAVPALSFSSFTGWTRAIAGIGTGYTSAGLSLTLGASSIDITVGSGNNMFQASAVSPSAALTAGLYYRTIFTVTSSQSASNFGPTIYAGYVSTRFVWAVNKVMPGGGTFSQIGTTPTEYEVWAQAPTAFSGAQTEPMQVRFMTYLIGNPVVPFNRMVAGTLRCTGVVTQSFNPMP